MVQTRCPSPCTLLNLIYAYHLFHFFHITNKMKREKKICFSAAHKLFYNLSVEKEKGEGTSKCGTDSVTVVFVSINLRAQECMRYLHKSFHNSCGLWEHCICMTSPLWLVCAFSAALPATGAILAIPSISPSPTLTYNHTTACLVQAVLMQEFLSCLLSSFPGMVQEVSQIIS